MDKIFSKISSKHLDWAILGIVLILFSIGSMFSIKLVRYGYWIIVISSLTLFSYVNTTILNWHENKKIPNRTILLGFFGVIILIGFLGIQTPQMPFKKILLVIGVLLIIPGIYEAVKT